MKPFITGAALVLFVAPVSAADKNEDKVKGAAVAFLKAMKAKDATAALKLSDVPFIYKDGDNVGVMKDAGALKTRLKEKFDEINDTDSIPTEVKSLYKFAEIRGKIRDDAQRKTVEDILGKDGLIAVVTVDDKPLPILVRVADGKATVVGLWR